MTLIDLLLLLGVSQVIEDGCVKQSSLDSGTNDCNQLVAEHLNTSLLCSNCHSSTLHYRRIRGDMIETFKILTGKYDMRATQTMLRASSSLTRGHNSRLNKFRVKYDLRKYYFTSRVVNVWNSLSSFVVSADSVNCFKNRLDKCWSNHDIIYDYQADIHGTGNRSEVVL